jgi:CheY-like chemotaxis protein
VAEQPSPRKVLIVDDDPDVRATVAAYLSGVGFDVAQADSGLEALLEVRRLRPGGIVLDIMMPRLGGLQALQRIRALDPRIVVVAVSGAPDAELERQAVRAGAIACLVKPLVLAELASVLRGVRPRPRADPAPGPPPRPRAGRVLVVDDEADFREVLQDFLVDKGYDVRPAADGLAALSAVAGDAPDVVLLDIQMPGLGGVDVLAAIRAIAPAVQVIMVSGTSNTDLAARSLAFGAFDYVTKPVDLAYLERSLETAIIMNGLDQS